MKPFERPQKPSEIAQALRAVIEEARPRLDRIDEVASTRHPAPGKWSPREIIGHLIDSAQNNHGRFVRAQLSDDLVFPGYAQDDWVRVQRYSARDWSALVDLWTAYNVHLAHVIAHMPSAVVNQPRSKHNLHELAWKPVPATSPATLAYFMKDYVEHLEHHLRQIWAATGV